MFIASAIFRKMLLRERNGSRFAPAKMHIKDLVSINISLPWSEARHGPRDHIPILPFLSSNHSRGRQPLSAIDNQHCTVDEASGIRAQKNRGRFDVADATEAAKRNILA